ncbi:MAG: site-specific DNA-methyltransferase [Cellvibrionales bacterium]|nr:site-specific DNA-methyltransferase [Cellvibrionales bacterium]
MNHLYYGDNLTIMQEMESASVDLIYLDPPFNSNRSYNAIYKDETGRPLPDQIDAFCDLWTLNEEHERAIRHMPVILREAGLDDETVEFWRLWMNALRKTQPTMLAYLSYMMQRLIVMKRLLRPTGSIYLHCDPTASHYIKVMMDVVFGNKNFRNEIIWAYTGPSGTKSQYPRKHDVVLFYSKGDKWVFNSDNIRIPYKKLSTQKGGGGIGGDMDEKAVAEYVKRGKIPESWWSDISPVGRIKSERLGYATQKPVTLLKRIISASSNEGDTVLDPFCGCATTLEAAHRLKRNWIGIDIAIHAIKRVAAIRLGERCHLKQGKDFAIAGIPHSLEGAKDLWERDKYHFQKWAVEEVDGFVTAKRTADGGIDGRLYFDMPGQRDLQSMILEVKGGKNVSIADFRALHSVLEREEALMAGLITMEPLPDRQKTNFLKLAAQAGDLEMPGSIRHYPKLQILSVPEILEGKRFATPTPMGKSGSLQNKLSYGDDQN